MESGGAEWGGANACEGDRALAALLLLHGRVCNGGIEHAFSLAHEKLAAGLDGFKFFGLGDVALVFECGSEADAAAYEAADKLYGELIPNDDVIVGRFEALYASSPSKFAPIDGG